MCVCTRHDTFKAIGYVIEKNKDYFPELNGKIRLYNTQNWESYICLYRYHGRP